MITKDIELLSTLDFGLPAYIIVTEFKQPISKISVAK
jgi:hypothetical protein